MLATRPRLILERRIRAAPAKVYAAWTDPEKIRRWWGPDQGPTTRAETDVRVGGRFRVCFRTMDGGEHEVVGVYREVVPDRRLAFTWNWVSAPERESLVTVEVAPDGEGTLLTLTHEEIVPDTAHDYVRGWSGSLDKLARLFA